MLNNLRTWAADNDEVSRPTGRNLRNLNPLITSRSSLEMAWWGFLVDGQPARFPSINTRAERLASGKQPIAGRAIVPVSFWREMEKPSRVWHRFSHAADELLGLAAVTRPGRTSDGHEFTCYSVVMRPAATHLESVHDRMPLLVSPGFADEWLESSAAPQHLIDAAMGDSSALAKSITVRAEGAGSRPGASNGLL